MTQRPTASPRNRSVLVLGLSLGGISLLVLTACGVWLTNSTKLLQSGASVDAILFIDVPGRIAIDGTLQVDGPAPVPVSVGSHTLTFFDNGSQSPMEVTVQQGEFKYVANPALARSYSADASHGTLYVAAFPPDTTIEVPDCTPIAASRPVICRSVHTLGAQLSPGTYTLNYTNPYLGDSEESFTMGADSLIRREHSFITTVAEWDEWRQQHGEIIERNYPRYYRRYGGGSALLLPFRATGELVGELFD